MGTIDRPEDDDGSSGESAPPAPPFAAKVVAWDDGDRVGTLRSSEGHELKFGGSACGAGFTPAIGVDCWVVETKPDPRGGVRAKLVNATGQQGLTPEAEAIARVAEKKRAVAEARERELAHDRQVRARPAEEHFRQIREWTGFELPPLFLRAVADGATAYGDDPEGVEYRVLRARPEPPLLLCCWDVEWLAPHRIVEELRPAAEQPLTEADSSRPGGVTWDEVRRSFEYDIPFARIRGGGGWWVFRSDRGSGDATPVFECSSAGDRIGFAPSFEGFVYRSMLLALARQDGDEEAEVHAFLERCVSRVRPYLGARWGTHLAALLGRAPIQRELPRTGPLGSPGATFAYLSPQELNETTRRELAFSHLDAYVVSETPTS